ncbi:DNA-binding CsgD family transcriptional regulator [Microbacterium ginsengiterrae]|uniref:DNA-binding CsgD family transcriptional regulator n=1 Tax=Microbacterium ginsengiterrae TaxID=546115 RepID=A0A7W9CB35_9MICO|nr:LuxR family transcriptional regulator [Microbacterium ginsengiterrae]MBB5742248.1 DNA-binding CsgD family transcriptional regulator [Microbacterium ginsengiterrae]
MNFHDVAAAKLELDRARKAGNPDGIAAAAMNNFWPLYCSHYDELIAAIQSLPARDLDRYPMLRATHPMTRVMAQSGRPYKPLIYQDDARKLPPEQLDVLTLAQMIAFRFSGDVAAALVYAQRLDERIATVASESRYRTDGPLWFLHAQIGTTYLIAGDSAYALRKFTVAQQLAELSPLPDAVRFVLSRSALAHTLRGSLSEAEAALTAARREPEPTPAHVVSVRGTESATAALIAVERLSDDVDAHLAALEPFYSNDLSWPFALLARTRALLAKRRPHEALEALHLAEDAHPVQHGSTATDIITAMRIEALAAAGEESRARDIADGSGHTGGRTAIARAGLALHQGRLDAATRELRQVAADFAHGPGTRGRHQLLSAWLEFSRRGNVTADTASAFARIAIAGSLRRSLSTLPSGVITAVRERLDENERPAFDAAIDSIHFRDLRTRPSLTDSESRVLHALPVYETVAEIARAFHVSPNTIKSQLKSLYRKLGCSSREEAIELGGKFQLVDRYAESAPAR